MKQSLDFVYVFPFRTQVVLLHLEIMAKKRKRQFIRENAANAVAAAQTGKTPSQLAVWMELFFYCVNMLVPSLMLLCLRCSWQFRFSCFVLCEILMRLFLMFLSVEIPMKKNSSATWSVGGISALQWPSMR
jgi:hypothetical protein